MLNRYATTALAISTAALLTACGGGGSGDSGNKMDDTAMTPMPDPGPPETRTAGQMLADGEALAAHHVAAVETRAGMTAPVDWNLIVQKIASGEYRFVVNDLTYNLVLEDGEDDEDASDTSFDVEAHHDGQPYPFGYGKLRYSHPDHDEYFVVVRHTSEAPHWRGHAIIGNRTTLNDTFMGTATFDDARALVEIYESDGRIWSQHRETYWTGDGQLVADFGAGTISGQFAGDWYTDRGGEDSRDENGEWPTIDMAVTLETAPITADGYTGAISLTGADVGGHLNASYEGSFYGPEAQNVAGVVNGTFTPVGETPSPVIGWFAAENHGE